MFRTLLTIIGAFAVVVGLIWVGQGLGYIRWPAESYMIDVRDWSVRGGILAALGVAIVLLARRTGRS